MPEHHKVPVVRINELAKHGNADSLGLAQVFGYQCVVRLDQFKPGLYVYVQPDSVVSETKPFSFLWSGRGYREAFDQPGEPVPDRYRRVTARKFRSEWSEGLLLPVSDFEELKFWVDKQEANLGEAEDISELLGITHWQPPEPGEFVGGNQTPRRPQRGLLWLVDTGLRGFGFNIEWSYWPVTVYGWYQLGLEMLGLLPEGTVTGNLRTRGPSNKPPIYDVENLKNYSGTFTPEDYVVVTEKVHGSNSRFTYVDGKMHAGSRNWWKGLKSKCIWRKCLEQNPYITEWCKEHEGYTLYGEVCPTQGGYKYGCKEGEVKFFAFDVRDPKGNWVPYTGLENPNGFTVSLPIPEDEWRERWVPRLYAGKYDKAKIKALVDGPSLVPGANTPREGVVIRAVDETKHVRGLGRAQCKLVSNSFLAGDSK